MERRHDHGSTNPIFTPVNEALARDFWYIVAAVVLLLAGIRGINSVQNTIRLVSASIDEMTLESPSLTLIWQTSQI